jgi:hypothetical protein
MVFPANGFQEHPWLLGRRCCYLPLCVWEMPRQARSSRVYAGPWRPLLRIGRIAGTFTVPAGTSDRMIGMPTIWVRAMPSTSP